MTGTKSFHDSLLSRYVLELRVPLPCYPMLRLECFIFKKAPEATASEMWTCDRCGAAGVLFSCPATRYWRFCSEACYEASRGKQEALLIFQACGVRWGPAFTPTFYCHCLLAMHYIS